MIFFLSLVKTGCCNELQWPTVGKMTSGFLLQKPISFFCDNSAGGFGTEELGCDLCGHSEFHVCLFSSIQLSRNLLILMLYHLLTSYLSYHSGDKITFLPSLLGYFQKCRCFLKACLLPLCCLSSGLFFSDLWPRFSRLISLADF